MKKILFISAVWCPACLIMRPRYHAVVKLHRDVQFIEIDFDDEKQLVDQYKIGTTLPVAIIFEDGRELGRIVGEIALTKLTERLARL